MAQKSISESPSELNCIEQTLLTEDNSSSDMKQPSRKRMLTRSSKYTGKQSNNNSRKPSTNKSVKNTGELTIEPINNSLNHYTNNSCDYPLTSHSLVSPISPTSSVLTSASNSVASNTNLSSPNLVSYDSMVEFMDVSRLQQELDHLIGHPQSPSDSPDSPVYENNNSLHSLAYTKDEPTLNRDDSSVTSYERYNESKRKMMSGNGSINGAVSHGNIEDKEEDDDDEELNEIEHEGFVTYLGRFIANQISDFVVGVRDNELYSNIKSIGTHYARMPELRALPSPTSCVGNDGPSKVIRYTIESLDPATAAFGTINDISSEQNVHITEFTDTKKTDAIENIMQTVNDNQLPKSRKSTKSVYISIFIILFTILWYIQLKQILYLSWY